MNRDITRASQKNLQRSHLILPLLTSHTLTLRSAPPDTKYLPDMLNRNDVTSPS